MQNMAYYLGMCRAQLAAPYVESTAVECERPGCHHEVWCDNRAKNVWTVLKVICAHCIAEFVPQNTGS